MPQLHEFASPEQRAASWQAHVQRTTDRIRQYQGKLDRLTQENKPETVGERIEIEEQVKAWTAQLRPKAETQTNAVETLKAQIAILSAQVTSLVQSAVQAVTPPPTAVPPPVREVSADTTTNGAADG